MTAAAQFHYNTVQAYEPPSWAKALRYQPTTYVKVGSNCEIDIAVHKCITAISLLVPFPGRLGRIL